MAHSIIPFYRTVRCTQLGWYDCMTILRSWNRLVRLCDRPACIYDQRLHLSILAKYGLRSPAEVAHGL